MSIKEDVERGVEEEMREPLMAEEKNLADGSEAHDESSKGNTWMVYFSTFVAVCGSYAFGSCVSSQSHFIQDLYTILETKEKKKKKKHDFVLC